jgi:hypothetical protein
MDLRQQLRPNAGHQARRAAGARYERTLAAVACRVEPVVAQPAPPQIRTCALNAYGSSVTRVSAPLWRITVLPCKPFRCCGRSGVWAERRSPAPSGTSPSGSHSGYCGDSTSIATSSLPSGGPPPTDGSSLGSHSTDNAHAASGTASDTGSAAVRADWRDPIATTPSSCDRGASSPFSV